MHHECVAGQRSRRHHFISSRLTEWTLNPPTQVPLPKKALIRSELVKAVEPPGHNNIAKGLGAGVVVGVLRRLISYMIM